MMDFTILARLDIEAEVSIKADSWEAALEKAQKMRVPDFAKPIQGETFMDFEEPRLTSIGQW